MLLFKHFDGQIRAKVEQMCRKYDMVAVDTHMHSRFTPVAGRITGSDGMHSIDDMCKAAKARGLHGIVFTEHDLLNHFPTVRAIASKYGLVTIPALEIYTLDGEVLGYFKPSVSVAAVNNLLSHARKQHAEDVVGEIKRLGGAAVAAHPYGRIVTTGLGSRLDKLHAQKHKNMPHGMEEYTMSAAYTRAPGKPKKLGIASLAGSDAHAKYNVGAAFTLFPKGALKNPGKMVKYIREKRTRGVPVDSVREQAAVISTARFGHPGWSIRTFGFFVYNIRRTVGGYFGHMLRRNK